MTAGRSWGVAAFVVSVGALGLYLVTGASPEPADGQPSEPVTEAQDSPPTTPDTVAPTKARDLACTFEVGDRLAFSLSQLSNFFINPMALMERQGINRLRPNRERKTLSSPAWLWRVLESDDEGWLLASLMTAPDVGVNGDPISDVVRQGFDHPVLFRLTRTCALGEVGYLSMAAPEAVLEQKMTLTLSEMQVSDAGRQWSAKQDDTMGRYAANYTQQGADVTRKKSHYVEVKRPDPNVEIKAKVLKGSATGVFDAEGRWFKSLKVEDRVVLRGISGTFVDVDTVLEIARTTVPDAHPFFSLQIDPSAYLFTAAHEVEQAKRRARYDRPVIPGLAARTLTSVVDEFAGLLAKKDNRLNEDALRLLVQYLRLDPAHVTTLLGLLRSGGVPGHAQSMTFLALELAGGEAVHDALRAATEDQGLSEMNRLRAVSAFADSRDAKDSFVDEMLDIRKRAQGRQDGSVDGASVLALGSLGANPSLSTEAKQRVSDLLVEGLDNAEGPAELTNALAALSNRRDEATAASITPHLDSEHEPVRAAAYEALQKLDQLPEPEALLSSLFEEESAAVRRRIADALKGMTDAMLPKDYMSAIDLLSSPLAQQDEMIRGTLIDILGTAVADIPETHQALIALFKVEKKGALLKKIGKYVSAQDLQ